MNIKETFVLCIIGSLYFLMICLACRLLWLCKTYVTEDQEEQRSLKKRPRPKTNAINEASIFASGIEDSSSDWLEENSQNNNVTEQSKECEPDVFTIA